MRHTHFSMRCVNGFWKKNQNVSCLSMFLVFTGFSARLGMTVTDKRSHGGRVQEQGEIVRSVAF